MATCRYCGQKTPLFLTEHKDCAMRHDQGLSSLEQYMRKFLQKKIGVSELKESLAKCRQNNFINDDDIAVVFDGVVKEYEATLRRPYSPESMHLVDDLIKITGVNYTQLCQYGSLYEFAKRLLRGFLIDYFQDKITLDLAQRRCSSVLKRFPLPQEQIEDAYWNVLDRAASKFLQEDTLPEKEDFKIQTYLCALELQLNNIPVKYQKGDIAKIGQIAVLKSLQQGIVPQSNFSATILLSKGESIIWAFNQVNAYKEKIVSENNGNSTGTSNQTDDNNTSEPLEHSIMELQGMGTLYITNKNLIFSSSERSFKTPFKKIIDITPSNDRVEIHPEWHDTKRLVYVGFDPWFLMNVLSCLGNLSD